jgi:hypothetical protein
MVPYLEATKLACLKLLIFRYHSMVDLAVNPGLGPCSATILGETGTPNREQATQAVPCTLSTRRTLYISSSHSHHIVAN